MSLAICQRCSPRRGIYDDRVPLIGEYEPTPRTWVREQTERYEATDRREANTFPSFSRAEVAREAGRPAIVAESQRGRMTSMIPVQPFGRTGHESTRLLFGAAAIGNVSQEEADQTIELIRAHGINHIDTAASYGDAELRLGPWMESHRDEFFLATKTGERTRALAFEEIERSLERLRTDHVDLIQLHNLVDPEEWETAFAGGGAIEAVIEAQAQGLVRYIGVTGHGVTVARQHLRSLEQYPFDSVLLPYNFPMSRNAGYLADFEELVAVCVDRGVAIQTIKAITRGPWDQKPAANTWYEPLTDQDAIDIAVGWVLGRDGVFLNTVGDIHLLPKVIDAAERFTQRPSDDQMRELEAAFGLEALFV
jgi:aryl-alcohol dehydrogenase-like predicted oxidoreductase